MESPRPRVLVVEDVNIPRKIATMVLEKIGCRVDAANSGQLAVKKYDCHRYDFIFMDVGLSVQEGIMVTNSVRKLQARGRSRPTIVAITADENEGFHNEELAADIDDMVLKPLTPARAKQVVDRHY